MNARSKYIQYNYSPLILYLIWICLAATHNISGSEPEEETLSFEEMNALAQKGPFQKKKAFNPILFGNLLSQLKIPQKTVPLFQHISLKTPTITQAPSTFPLGFTVKGSLTFEGHEVEGTFLAIQSIQGIREYSLTIVLPHNWKLSSIFPELKNLDTLSLPTGYFILSTMDYTDPQTGVNIVKGLNFVAELELTGPLQLVQTFLDKSKGYFAVKGGRAQFQGVIASNIIESQFSAIIPAQIGIDLEKLYKEGKLITSPYPLKTISTGDLIITLSPSDLGFKIGSGIILGLATQTKPLELRAEVTLTAQKARFDGFTVGTYDPAFGLSWLALEEFGMFIEIDYIAEELLAAIGVPFTGIGFRGGLGLGTIPHRTTINTTAAIQVSSRTIGNIVFEGSTDKLDISDIVQLFTKAIKKEIPMSQIPVIKFTDVHLMLALMDTTVAGKKYSQGFSINSAWEIWKLQGRVALEILISSQSLRAQGWLKNIETPIIRITGTENNKTHKASDGWDLDIIMTPYQQQVSGSAAIEIPPLKLKGSADIHYADLKLDAHVIFKVINLFDAEFKIALDPLNPQNFDAQFNLEQGFAEFINKELPKALEQLNKNTAGNSNQGQSKTNQKVTTEINRVNDRINQLDRETDTLRNNCNAAPFYQKAFDQSCLNIVSKQTEKAGLIAYRETLLKSGIAQKSVNALTQIGNVLAQGITIVNVKRAAGEISGHDVAMGKMAKLTELNIEINIPTMQKKSIILRDLEFDFTDVEHSLFSIIQLLLAQFLKTR